VAELSSKKLSMTRELNDTAHVDSQQDSKLSSYRDAEERQKIAAYVKLQHREIESIKTEITILRRKEPLRTTAVSMTAPAMMPLPPTAIDLQIEEERNKANSTSAGNDKGVGRVSPMFPPIPNKRGGSGSLTGGAMKHLDVSINNRTSKK